MREQLSEMDQVKFAEWCDRLDTYAKSLGLLGGPHTISTGRECWIGFFKDGLTPEEALAEDESNAL